MTAARRARGRVGKTRTGCLLTLALIALGLYYGLPAGELYVRYWRFKEAIKTEARLAPSIDDATIRRRLRERAETLGLPDEANQITIRRTMRPRREIYITTTYEEAYERILFSRVFTLKPEVRHPL